MEKWLGPLAAAAELLSRMKTAPKWAWLHFSHQWLENKKPLAQQARGLIKTNFQPLTAVS
jgi:hypothetical protein